MPDKVAENTPAQFRRMLVNKCQQEFEAGLEPGAIPCYMYLTEEERQALASRGNSKASSKAGSDNGKEEGEIAEASADSAVGNIKMDLPDVEVVALTQEDEDRMQALRKRVLGNCQFVGQLFQYKMITVRITTGICSMLLAEVRWWVVVLPGGDDGVYVVVHVCCTPPSCCTSCIEPTCVLPLQPQENPRFIVIECLCKFLPQVGRLLEAQRDTKIQANTGKPMSGKEVMMGYMARIRRWIDNRVADSRLRFMLMVRDDFVHDVYLCTPCTHTP